MTIAEYLASEQAREDVKALLQSVRWDSAGDAISVNPWPQQIAPRTKLHTDFTIGPWIRCSIWSQDEADNYELECAAYYRPDGDRFVVTDLGEGVRALRLRTGQPIEGWQSWCDGIVDSTAGVIRKQDVKADQLPDAICRVMLASLRVAGVSNV